METITSTLFYENLPTIKFGKFTIVELPDADKIWIEYETGEGGEFSRAEFEKVIKDFYREKF